MDTQADRLDLDAVKWAVWNEPVQMTFGHNDGYRLLRFWKPGCGTIYLRDDGMVGPDKEEDELISWLSDLLLTLDRRLDGLLSQSLLRQADEEGIRLALPEGVDGWWYHQLVSQLLAADEEADTMPEELPEDLIFTPKEVEQLRMAADGIERYAITEDSDAEGFDEQVDWAVGFAVDALRLLADFQPKAAEQG